MSTESRTSTFPAALAWTVLALAVAQVLAPIVATAAGGSSPAGSTVDLLITPAGYTFSIWGLVYTLCVVTAVSFLIRRSTATADPRALLARLAIACAGAAVWIVFSALEASWFTSATLTVMVLALLDAVRIVAREAPPDASRWHVVLVRATVGTYAAWATAAVFQNWASDLAESTLDPSSVGWQLSLLLASAVVGVIVTLMVGARVPLYPVTLLWALAGIVVTARGETSSVLLTCVVAMVAVVVATGVSHLRLGRVGSRTARA